jgi:hypothetical protein
MSDDDVEVEDRTGWSVRERWAAPFGDVDRRNLVAAHVPLEAIIEHEDGMHTLDLEVLLAARWELTDDGGLSAPKVDSRDC